MDTIEKVFLVIILTMSFMFSVRALGMAVDANNQTQKLEKRVLVLETRVNIYSGYTGANEN